MTITALLSCISSALLKLRVVLRTPKLQFCFFKKIFLHYLEIEIQNKMQVSPCFMRHPYVSLEANSGLSVSRAAAGSGTLSL